MIPSLPSSIPGLLQAYTLVPEGRKILLFEVVRKGQELLQEPSPSMELLERVLLIHDLCLEEVVPGEVLPVKLPEVIHEVRKRARANIPTIWDRLGVACEG